MAEGSPDPASQSSQNKPLSQEEEEAAIIEPGVTWSLQERTEQSLPVVLSAFSVCRVSS